ncbi:alpha/beta hydrolase [Synechococcus sp. CCY 0621]|uniref:alpha/beta fold hydrolase n=1 Tax=Synechococcus sp. CCY 0621 TaxID=2815603 RepID=UPI001C21268C|nr:alpha/beta hydrolase [Synechococcus sp. CCY 0621]
MHPTPDKTSLEKIKEGLDKGGYQCDQLIASVAAKKLSFRGFSYYCKDIPVATPDITPTLFVSGAFQSMPSWHRFARLFLGRGKPVIMVDLPGTGRADPLPTEYGLDYLAATIKHMLDELGHHKVAVVAASYGTPIAFRFAELHPSMVESLVLCGTMKEVPHHIHGDLAHSFQTLEEGKMEQFANELLGVSGPQQGCGLICTDPEKPIARRKLAHRLLYSQLINMNAADREKYVINTKRLLNHGQIALGSPPAVRTLVFTGEHDCFTRPEFCREIASAFCKATFTTIQQADHLFHIEQFDTTAELLFRFSYNQPIDDIPMLNAIELVGRKIKKRFSLQKAQTSSNLHCQKKFNQATMPKGRSSLALTP